MADFRIRYTDENNLLGYARLIGFANGGVWTSGFLPDGSGDFFMTDPMRTDPDDGYWWRTLRINGNNPFVPGGLVLPDGTYGITIYPPEDPNTPGYVQPVVAVIA